MYARRPVRRRTFKRKASKKKSFKRKGSIKRRRTVAVAKRRKRFPTMGPRTQLTTFPMHRADRVRMKMRADGQVIWYPITIGTQVDPDVGYNCSVAIPMNQISSTVPGIAWSPITTGYTTGGLPAPGFSSPNPQGWAELFSTYTVAQVRGCKMSFELTQGENSGLGIQTIPIDVCVVPMTGTQYLSQNVPASTPFNKVCHQPKAKRSQVFRSADAISAGLGGTCRFTMFDSPGKMLAVPGYYNNASSWQGGSVGPTDLLYYVVYLSGHAPLPTNTYFSLGIKLEWSVEFFLRAAVPWECPRPLAPLPESKEEKSPMDEEEAAFDSLPEYMAVAAIASPPGGGGAPPPTLTKPTLTQPTLTRPVDGGQGAPQGRPLPPPGGAPPVVPLPVYNPGLSTSSRAPIPLVRTESKKLVLK